jgi:hypothetical protein
MSRKQQGPCPTCGHQKAPTTQEIVMRQLLTSRPRKGTDES